MYRVWFTQANGHRDYLDGNGEGLNEDDAIQIMNQLKYMGNRDVRIAYIGDPADEVTYTTEEYDDIIRYCDIYSCEDCPRYGDDCDGKWNEGDE